MEYITLGGAESIPRTHDVSWQTHYKHCLYILCNSHHRSICKVKTKSNADCCNTYIHIYIHYNIMISVFVRYIHVVYIIVYTHARHGWPSSSPPSGRGPLTPPNPRALREVRLMHCWRTAVVVVAAACSRSANALSIPPEHIPSTHIHPHRTGTHPPLSPSRPGHVYTRHWQARHSSSFSTLQTRPLLDSSRPIAKPDEHATGTHTWTTTLSLSLSDLLNITQRERTRNLCQTTDVIQNNTTAAAAIVRRVFGRAHRRRRVVCVGGRKLSRVLRKTGHVSMWQD